MNLTRTAMALAAVAALAAPATAAAQDPIEVYLTGDPKCTILVENNAAVDRFYHCYGIDVNTDNEGCEVAYSTGQAPGHYDCIALPTRH